MVFITGNGWELFISRLREQVRGDKRRTLGTYQVFHDGRPRPSLSGHICEAGGPGDNSKAKNGKRVEPGVYPLATQDGTKYVTFGYSGGKSYPRPGFELVRTGKRTEILVHPGVGFLSSVGCINPTSTPGDPRWNIDFADSRARVIALIEDMRNYLAGGFPTRNGRPIPRAQVVIAGDPIPSAASLGIFAVLPSTAGPLSLSPTNATARNRPEDGLPVSVFHAAAKPPPDPAKRAIYDAYISAFTSSAGLNTLRKYGITENWDRLMHFFAQASHETGGFSLVRESLYYTSVKAIRRAWKKRASAHTDQWITSNLLRRPIDLGDWAYGGRMGNRRGTEDGFNYRGGGTFQTTGRSAYAAKGKLAKVDLEGNPKLIEDPLVSLLAACAEWGGLECNRFADRGEIEKISRGINIGNPAASTPSNGEADRIAKYRKFFKAVKDANLVA